jgi:dolichol-phosphate mannosyltransferase
MHNEGGNAERVLRDVVSQLAAANRPYEIICVDDGSTDETSAVVDAAAGGDEHVRAIHLSRNFGKEAALAAGLEAARGRAVVMLDADLQHPPDLIPAMIAKWNEGYDVVEAVKADAEARGRESWVYRTASSLFYRLMGTAARERLQGSSDFKLLDRQVVNALLAFPERHRFFRGLVACVGFRVARLPFQVRDRASGGTKWSLTLLARYALRNVVAFTSMPLRLVAWLGFWILLLDVVLGLQTLWNWWRGAAVTGFTTVILAVVGLGGLILLSLGVIALYLAQMYEELKARPVFVVRHSRPEDTRPGAPGTGSGPTEAPVPESDVR